MGSHLLQMRGLKLNNRRFELECEDVASFTDAWIETPGGIAKKLLRHVASFTDAWIETWVKSTLIPSPSSHLLQMRGLKL